MRPLESVRAMYRLLFQAWGRQHWWPAESPFEVIVGAILTQNTAWTNVEKALARLREAGALSLAGIRRHSEEDLGGLIRSSGYFRQKAARLKAFVEFVDGEFHGSLDQMFALPTSELRQRLLALRGVGPETADSILLYAGNHPVFVVDAYTRRILDRHGVLPYDSDYEEIRALCEAALGQPEFVAEAEAWLAVPKHESARTAADRPGSCHEPSAVSTAARCATAQVFNEMHGLLVGVAKTHCLKSQARCEMCPLASLLSRSQKAKLGKEGLLKTS